jgi:carboxypeptidase C (cathepsin A)
MRQAMSRRFGGAFALVVMCCAFTVWAQPVGQLRAAPPSAPEEPTSQVNGTASIGRQKVDYRVTTGRLPVMDKTGKAKSSMFFIAYTRKTDVKPENRPLTFCFNGGPGSSSSYVHIAAFGPRTLSIDDDGKSIPKPYTLVDNYNSLLDVTDLVFIDPISTGYSRPEKDDEAKLFHGVDEDSESVGEFIRSYVEKYERGESPTFIAGESYGTLRAAALSSYLQKHPGVRLVGIMLISTVLDYSTISFGQNNDLPNVLFLPAYASVALYHNKVEGERSKLLPEVEKFANGPYAEALKKGKELPEDERSTIAKTVSKYTGLSEEYVLKANLRINAGAFRSELLRDSKELIGRYDGRVKAKSSGNGKGGGGDPSATLISAPLAECMNSYLADKLEIKTDLKYNMTGKVNPWNFGPSRGKATVVPRLREAMEKDSSLRVFVACGYCDLATPYSVAKYTMANLGGPKSLQDRITINCYEGGHMMYTVKESHQRLKEDMARFILAPERAPPPRER